MLQAVDLRQYVGRQVGAEDLGVQGLADFGSLPVAGDDLAVQFGQTLPRFAGQRSFDLRQFGFQLHVLHRLPAGGDGRQDAVALAVEHLNGFRLQAGDHGGPIPAVEVLSHRVGALHCDAATGDQRVELLAHVREVGAAGLPDDRIEAVGDEAVEVLLGVDHALPRLGELALDGVARRDRAANFRLDLAGDVGGGRRVGEFRSLRGVDRGGVHRDEIGQSTPLDGHGLAQAVKHMAKCGITSRQRRVPDAQPGHELVAQPKPDAQFPVFDQMHGLDHIQHDGVRAQDFDLAVDAKTVRGRGILGRRIEQILARRVDHDQGGGAVDRRDGKGRHGRQGQQDEGRREDQFRLATEETQYVAHFHMRLIHGCTRAGMSWRSRIRDMKRAGQSNCRREQ